MPRAGMYPLATDFGVGVEDDLLEMDPYWVIAVIRLGQPLSYNRKTQQSDSNDLSSGASLRVDAPLVISDDCIQLNVSAAKGGYTKSMTATLKQTNINYLVEILPSDWVLAWMVNNRTDYLDLLRRIPDVAGGKTTDASGKKITCNGFSDGLKFVGRIDDVYKDVVVDPATGIKISNYSLKCTGFSELDTMMYYDYALATSDAQGGNFGWMARFGVTTDALFGNDSEEGIEENNINRIIPTLLDLVLGKGPDKSGDITLDGEGGDVSATPPLSVQNKAHGSGNDPPFSYLVPIAVGNLLGKTSTSKGIMSYADVIELWTGVHSYSNKNGKQMFTPDFSYSSGQNRRVTTNKLLGTFLPFMPDFANRPIWGVMQQYVNHTINEIYTALKVNPDGNVVPTIVFRQIPFTTDAFTIPAGDGKATQKTATEKFFEPDDATLAVTKFLDLPRWYISPSMVKRVHVGRSNATRTNLVHIYGTSTNLENQGINTQYQMLNNPPIQDAVDIFRAGCRTHTSSVDCWVDDTVGNTPGKWMALVADWMMGSHLPLNGVIDVYGIQSPIAEGDNIQFDGVVYHVMNVDHYCTIDPNSGMKHFGTTLQITNGMRAIESTPAFNDSDLSKGLQPIYPGIEIEDNTKYDPGLSLEGDRTTGGIRDVRTEDHDVDAVSDNDTDLQSPLDPTAGSTPEQSAKQRRDIDNAVAPPPDTDLKDLL